MEHNRKSDIIMLTAGTVLALLSAAGIAAGTFCDIDIAQAVYDPGNVFWRIFTVLGEYPFMAV